MTPRFAKEKLFRPGRQDPQRLPRFCIPLLLRLLKSASGCFPQTGEVPGAAKAAGRERSSPPVAPLRLSQTLAALAIQGSCLISSERDPLRGGYSPHAQRCLNASEKLPTWKHHRTATPSELLGPALVSLDHLPAGVRGAQTGPAAPLPFWLR